MMMQQTVSRGKRSRWGEIDSRFDTVSMMLKMMMMEMMIMKMMMMKERWKLR